MGFWFDFLTSKKFNWRFKLANLIMRDDLRNYLAVDCLVLENISEANNCTEFQKRKLKRIREDLESLMCSK